MTTISANLQAVIARIEAAARQFGRNPDDISLLAVSKTWPAADVHEAALAGQKSFGENYVQEGADKATTLAALKEGASVAHVTVNGLGERAGSCPLEPLALSLEALYGQSTGIVLNKLTELSKLVEELSRFPVPPIKPVVGNKLFGWETGLPSSLWTNAKTENPLIMLPYHYSLTGREEPVLYIGKKSGKDNVKYWLAKTGLSLDDEGEKTLLQKVKDLSISLKRDLNEDEFRGLVSRVKEESACNQ